MAHRFTHRVLLVVPLVLFLSACQSLEEQIGAAAEQVGIDTQDESFSILHHAPPAGMSWVECADGRNDGRMRTIGPAGGRIVLSGGHVLEVSSQAVDRQIDFVFVEPRSRHIVVNARAVGAERLGGEGLRLIVSWRDRRGCEVPPGAVIARIVPGGTAEPLRATSRDEDFIEVRLDSLSTFAIAS